MKTKRRIHASKADADKADRESKRRHYLRHRARYIIRADEKRRKMADFIREQKSKPCQDCGIQYPPYIMDFDHRVGSDKSMDVSRMTGCGSWKKLELEISKCDVVCSNCHRKRTYDRMLSRV